MKRLLQSNIFWCIVFAPFFVSMFYLDHFVLWLVFIVYFFFIGVLIIGFSLLPLTKIESRLKRYILKTTNILTGSAIIIFFSIFFGKSFLDIPQYMNKEYKTVIGTPTYISKTRSRDYWQTIKIEEITFRTMIYELPQEYTNAKLKITYLPKSKYIIDIEYAN